MRFNRNMIWMSALALFFVYVPHVDAATLKLNPNTGVYTVGKPFTVSVLLNTDG